MRLESSEWGCSSILQISRQRGRNQDDNRVHALFFGAWCWSLPCALSIIGPWSLVDKGMLANASDESNALGDKCMGIGCRRDCRNRPSMRDTPSRDLCTFALNLANPWFSILFVSPHPKPDTILASVVWSVFPSSACLKTTDSSTCMTLTWSRFLVRHRTVFPKGSTSLSSMTHVSALVMIPCGAHLGKAPRFRISRVVSNEPDSVWVRDTTSQETTWAAYGFG